MTYDDWKLETPPTGISFYDLELEAQIKKAELLIEERKEDRQSLLHSTLPKGFSHQDFLDHLDELIWYDRLILRLEIVHANLLIELGK